MQTDITRVWLTYLLMAAHRTGLAPMSKKRLHRLVFLSNCLAPLFEATPASAQIVKYKRGPFYPVVQWELDRLATISFTSTTVTAGGRTQTTRSAHEPEQLSSIAAVSTTAAVWKLTSPK